MKKTRQIIRYLDKPLFIITAILFLFGLVMIFSASNVTAYMSGRSAYDFFLRQGLFLIIGFVLFCLIIRFTTKAYGMMSHLLLVIFTAVLILLLIYGKATNYAVSWIRIGSFTIQPSEFIKIIMIIYVLIV